MGSYGVKYDSKISDIIYVCSLRKGRGLSKNQGRHLWTGLLSLCSYHRCCRRTLDFSRFCHSWHTLGSLHKLTPREIEANGRKVAVNGHHVEVSISCKYCRNKATITLYLLTCRNTYRVSCSESIVNKFFTVMDLLSRNVQDLQKIDIST